MNMNKIFRDHTQIKVDMSRHGPIRTYHISELPPEEQQRLMNLPRPRKPIEEPGLRLNKRRRKG